MKRIVLVINQDKVDLLDELGFSPCGKRTVNGKDAYQYVVTDRLYKILNDKSKFTKKDYFEDTKLTF